MADQSRPTRVRPVFADAGRAFLDADQPLLVTDAATGITLTFRHEPGQGNFLRATGGVLGPRTIVMRILDETHLEEVAGSVLDDPLAIADAQQRVRSELRADLDRASARLAAHPRQPSPVTVRLRQDLAAARARGPRPAESETSRRLREDLAAATAPAEPAGRRSSLPREIAITTWVRRGAMMVRRDALDGDDPDHPYNHVKAAWGVDPEAYGIAKPAPLRTPWSEDPDEPQP